MSMVQNERLYLLKDSERINPLETGDLNEKNQLFIHDLHSTLSDKESFLQDFLVILKHTLPNY